MTEEIIIPEILKKYIKSEEEMEKLNPIISLIREQEPGRILGRISDKKELAREFISIVPLHYDQNQIFWMWDRHKYAWKIVDELDVMLWIDKSAEVNVINPKEKAELLNALKLEARRNTPKPIPKTWIQFDKEIIDIETGDRFNASPEYFVTNPVPHKLGRHPNVDKFRQLFSEWVAHDDVQKLFQIMAYSLLPDYPIERVICLFGEGSNGKSLYRQIVRNIVGDPNCVSTTLEKLSQSRFEATKLYKKLVCEMGETNLHKLENTQVIKTLVSGKDLIGGEYKNKPHFDFLNYAKLLISTNNLPPTDDKTDGFYRKWMLIDFPNQFQEGEDVLKRFTEQDYQNLCIYLVEVLISLLKAGKFDLEGSILDRRVRYEARSNPFDKFWSEFVNDQDPNANIPKWELTQRLNQWFAEHRFRTMSDVSISKEMKHRGLSDTVIKREWYEEGELKKRAVRVWEGVGWK